MDRLSWDGYVTVWAGLHGGFDVHRATPVVRGWLRLGYRVGRVLSRLGVSPAAVTTTGLLLCLLVPATAGHGAGGAFAAAALVLLAAVADTVDGAVAVIGSRTSQLGYLYDSVADRIGEASWLAAFWVLGAPGPLVVICGALCWLHEYVRARAASAGVAEDPGAGLLGSFVSPATGAGELGACSPPPNPGSGCARPGTVVGAVTVGERPTRVCVAVVGLLLAGATALISADLAAGTVTMVAAAWVLLGVCGLTQLLSAVRRSLA